MQLLASAAISNVVGGDGREIAIGATEVAVGVMAVGGVFITAVQAFEAVGVCSTVGNILLMLGFCMGAGALFNDAADRFHD